APWLVIFDNAPDAATVRPFVPAGSARVIITSRNSSFTGLAEAMSLDQWDQATTVAYLERRIGRGSAAELSALAARIDGLPLAAEMAAAYLVENGTLSVAAYEARLLQMMDERPEDMAGDYPDSVYGTLSAAIAAVAERKQGEAALGILNICAFLAPEGVELGLLTATAEKTDRLPDPPRAALTDDVDRATALSALSNYSLLRLGEDTKWGETLHLHRLIREIAQARLDEAEARHWAGAAVRMVNGAFPNEVRDDTRTWPACARLAQHAEALALVQFGAGDNALEQDRLLNQAAVFRSVRGDDSGAIRLLRRSLEVMEISRHEDPLAIAAVLDTLAGRQKENEATWAEAENHYRRALEIKEVELSPNDPLLAMTLSNFAGLFQRRGEFAEAARMTERTAEIVRIALGEDSVEYAISLANLGSIYGDWGQQTNDAELMGFEKECKELALVTTVSARGMRHPVISTNYNNLAISYANAGDFTLAAGMMARALAINLSLDRLAHPEAQRGIEMLFHFWTNSGRVEKAERLQANDGSDLYPIIEQIEQEHRDWVAEDPENRHFGPPSPVTGALA
ncbi:MAG: tetratricopeptide repeat protein, partial [Pikeienuella sp.]